MQSFDAHYSIAANGSIAVSEDILVDFGSSANHGIFRYIPTEQQVDAKTKRVASISKIKVDDGSGQAIPFSTSKPSGNVELKIGDPNKLVMAVRRYRIAYTLTGALTAFSDHDELYWNITGSGWQFPLEKATATVDGPAGSFGDVTCFEGAVGGNRQLCRDS